MYNRFYLNVPYAQKDEAKQLGAKWDPERKSWYYDGNPEGYINFAKWIFDIDNAEGVLIACDYIYVVESTRECWKCKKETRVVGLGMEKIVEITDTMEDDENGNPIYAMDITGFDAEKTLYITWIEDEKEVPDFLLKYLKDNYNVKTVKFNEGGEAFANCCDHCGAVQGNFFIFDEYDTPFTLVEPDMEKNIEKVQKMKIKRIPLKENIVLNTPYFSVGETDYMYLKYGNVEDVKL